MLGILKDKNFVQMLEILLRPEDKVIFTAPLSERAASPAELLEYARVDQKEAIDDAEPALDWILCYKILEIFCLLSGAG